MAFGFPEEVLYGADLTRTDGGCLGPEGVADQDIEFRSGFHRFRPRDPECARPQEIRRSWSNGITEERNIHKEMGGVPFVKV